MKEAIKTNPDQLPTSASNRSVRRTVFALALVCSLVAVTVQPAQAQTFTLLHNFTGGADGGVPYGGLNLDQAGNIYGTASAGGHAGNNCTATGCGTVFKLTYRGFGWTFAPLYDFQGDHDGATPYAGVTIGPNGTLYGTTLLGGDDSAGTVFNLRPPAHATGNVLGGWTEAVLYQFTCGSDGCNPAYGSIILDPAGNIYGTTYQGGAPCDDGSCGTVFKLTSGGVVTSYDFPGRSAGGNPLSGVILDASGNLYGTTSNNNYAPVVYELTPSGSGWTESILHTFPFMQVSQGGVIFGASGDLLGTTLSFNLQNFGNAVYQLSASGGQWTYIPLYTFGGNANAGPWSGVVQSADGTLYGTTCGEGRYANGSVFKLTFQGGWTEIDLYDFTGGEDGECPVGGVALDADGNVYGTTAYGGQYGYGVVWEITP
jgi:uncharacterized repeat protein (TIGR03803 family)